MIKIKNVSLSISETSILNNISFNIQNAEIIAIIGSSGAGKTSLFKLLTKEINPTLGAIYLNNLSLNELSFKGVQQYRRKIGVIYQDFKLLKNKTVLENINYAIEICGNQSSQKTLQLLDTVGLKDKANNFPHQLSGGEKQRVAIARALIHDPQVLIADEATGNLDPQNTKDIANLFLKINKENNITIIASTHDPQLVKQLNPRVIRIEKGAVFLDQKNANINEVFDKLL